MMQRKLKKRIRDASTSLSMTTRRVYKRKPKLFFGTILLITATLLVGIKLWAGGKPVEGAWFNNNWAFRQRVDVTVTSSASDISNLETLITVNTSTLISASKLQSSCQDLRFTNVNGGLLNYYIDSGCNTSTTKIWIMADLVPKNTTAYTLYMYYGNPGASAGSNSFYFDNVVGLTGYWTLNDGSGTTAIDSSISGKNGTVTINSGGTQTTATQAWSNGSSGQYSGSVNFDGTDDYTIASLNGTAYTNATISVWFKATSNTGQKGIFQWANALTSSTPFVLLQDNAGTLQYYVDGNYRDTSQTITTGQWYNAVITLSGGTTWKFYLNGNLLSTYSGGVTFQATATTVYFGNGFNGYFNGQVDEVKIYNTTKNGIEIAGDYINKNCGGLTCTIATSPVGTSKPTTSFGTEEDGPGAILTYKFDENTGTTANDSSSNANNGTLNGTTKPAWTTSDQCVNNSCLYFDGQTSKVTGSKVASGIETISFWMRPSSTGKQGILNLDGGTHKISTNESGVISATGFTSPTYYINGIATTTPTLTQGQWNFVTITTSTSFNSNSSFTFGTDGTTFANGYFDELNFYNYVRSANQVQSGFNSGAESIKLNPAVPLNGLVADWPLDDTTTTQSFARVVNPGATTGRNIVVNGTFDADANWIKGSGWTISGGAAHFDGTPVVNSQITEASITTTGRVYTVTFTVLNRTAGGIRPLVGSSGVGTTVSANGTYTQTIISAGDGSFRMDAQIGFVGDIDNVSVQEINIPSSTATPTQLLTDGDMETAGTSSWTAGNSATLSKQSGTAHAGTQVLRVARNGVSTPYASQSVLTIGKVYRVYGYVRSDGSAAPRVGNNSMGTTLFTGVGTTTSWQGFDVTFVATGTDIDLGTTTNTGTQYVEYDDVTVALDTGIRNDSIMSTLDGDMEQSGTGYWQTNQNATLTKDSGTPHGGTQDLKVAYNGTSFPEAFQNILDPGRTYHITGFAAGDGTFAPRILVAGVVVFTGTSSTSYQFFDATVTATGNGISFRSQATSAGFALFDDITISEISPISGVNTNGVTVGAAANGHFTNAYSFDGTNDNVNIYSGTLNSAFNPNEGTIAAWAKVSGSGIWTDGGVHTIFDLFADSNDQLQFRKLNTNNTMQFNYTAGGITSTVSTTSIGGSTAWMQVVMTWSSTNNQMKAYINGVQVGSTQSGFGVWVGNLNSTTAMIGSQGAGTSPWSGLINDVRLYNRALSPVEISQLYNYAPGPVAYYKFEEGTGTTVNDSSGNALTGTWNGTLGNQWVIGKYGKAGNFNGSDNYVNIPTTSILNITGQVTLSMWVKPTSFTTFRGLVSKADPGSTNCATNCPFDSYITTSGALTFVRANGSALFSTTTTSTLTANQWYYLTFVDNGSALLTYINGQQAAVTTTGTYSTVTTSSGDVRIGERLDAVTKMLGPIDDVKIYNYARSASQIIDDMRGTASLFGTISAVGGSSASTQPTSALGYWKFDEGYGTTANNAGSAGSSNNGTLTNMASPAISTSGWQTAQSGNCKTNSCLAFDGSNDIVTLGTNSVMRQSSAITYSFWIYTTSTSLQYVMGTGASGGNGYGGVRVTAGSSGNVVFSWTPTAPGSDTNITSSTVNIPTSKWNHIAVAIDFTNQTSAIYVNGVAISSSLSQSATNWTPVTTYNSGQTDDIGGRFVNSQQVFSGDLDEVKVYDFPLTQAEVRNDMNAGAAFNNGATANTEASQLADTAGNPPIGYWNFEEGKGSTANDISGNNDPITLNANFNFNKSSGWATGKIGDAIHFDGVDDVAQTASGSNFNLVGAGNFTIQTWVKADTISNSVNSRLITEKQDATNGYHLAIINSASGTCGSRFIFEVDKAGTYSSSGCSTSNSAAAAGTWYFLTGVFNGTTNTATLYINGIAQVAGTSQSLGLGVTNILTLASQSTAGTNLFNGMFDEVKVYNYARTQAQIDYDYNRGIPIGWWKMNECQGVIANDSSGNGNNGTINIGGSGTQTSAGTCNTASTAWGNGATGKFNSSIKLDGNDDFISIGDISPFEFERTNAFSLSSWFKTTNSGGMSIITKQDDANNDQGYGIQTGGAGLVFFQIVNNYAGGNAIEVASANSTNYNDGNWHQLTATYDGSSSAGGVKLYFDGNQIPTNTTKNGLNATIITTAALQLGARATGATKQFFNGQIDDARIYNYQLSASQVKEIYNQGAAVRFGPTTGNP